ncbi:MalY/PatB family protein [Pantoea ananatis]|uniref:MalY/PatB family protein n=1 Tax=Pantoea ananas TaxID=553 RepID=UPI0007DAD377|nr:MalY/PatB family protein [Pantoea ananatis]MDC7861171.1 aminotransferase [Pantoea ananatis]UYL03755.1 pyridoxal phosphate-dependent aminotransferase [Pantoea ananatis]
MPFDQIINRRNTDSVKWDFAAKHLGQGAEQLLPMWVSDMDFAAPPQVIDALMQRCQHGVFGYSDRGQTYFDAMLTWYATRHDLYLKQEWICTTEGVIPGLSLLVQLLSNEKDGVVVQGPYYGSFEKIISLNHRQLLNSPLTETSESEYLMDFENLESLFKKYRPPLMILCNPHNPTGRCWRKAELCQLLTLCEAYNVIVLSDEIWADLVLPGHQFTSVLHLDPSWHNSVISATSSSKTFGLSSLRVSNFVIPDAQIRDRFAERLNAHGLDVFNVLSLSASTVAWQSGAGWLDQLLDYITANRQWFTEQVAEHVPWARVIPAEATYLLWIDCNKAGLNDQQLKAVIMHTADITPSMGYQFGPQGKGFIRLNLACPRDYLRLALEGLKRIRL